MSLPVFWPGFRSGTTASATAPTCSPPIRLNLPSYPSGAWYPVPFAWQLLFVLGAWLALGGAIRLHFLVRSREVLVLGLAYLLFAAVMTLAGLLPELQKLLPRVLFEAFNPNDKTNLAPYRFLHLAILIILGARFIPIDAAGLKATIWKPLVKCGQQSLEVFAVGIYLSFIGYFFLESTSNGIVAQLLVGAAGISIMTAVAYYRSWSKRVENMLASDFVGKGSPIPANKLNLVAQSVGPRRKNRRCCPASSRKCFNYLVGLARRRTRGIFSQPAN